MLYSTSVLIIVRSVFRVAEFAMGNNGYLLSNEWPLYVFDTIPMLVVCLLFFVWYPACLAGVKTKGHPDPGMELDGQVSEERFISKH